MEIESQIEEGTEDKTELQSPEHEKPIVFQCVHCNNIVGDSLSWVCGNDELETITVKHVSTEVTVDKSIKSVKEGLYGGSTYREVKCKGCERTIGRIYLATTCNLDEIRNAYTLFVRELNCYELGNSEEGAINQVDAESLSCANARYLLQEIRKIQGVALSLNTRLRHMEEYYMDKK